MTIRSNEPSETGAIFSSRASLAAPCRRRGVARPREEPDLSGERDQRAVGEGRNLFVEAEHRGSFQASGGMERTVIASPRTRIRRALAAGRVRTIGPSKLD